jgi:outer membrane protein assembly factor BamB
MNKNLSLCAAIVMFGLTAFSQKQFQKMFDLKFPVEVERWTSDDDNKWLVAGDDGEICGVDAVTGKVAWTLNVKERFGVKRCERWKYLTDDGVLEVYCKGDKKDEVKTHRIDPYSGLDLGTAAGKKPEKTKSGSWSVLKNRNSASWSSAGGVELENPNVTLYLEYDRPEMNASFGRGKRSSITVTCIGEYTWKSIVQGSFVRALCDNVVGFGDSFGGDFISVQGNKDVVFVQYEGLSVLDVKTGKLLWETSFDFSSFDFGAIKSEMIVGRAPMPVCDDKAAYIADLSKEVRAIRKFDLMTGKILWESEKLPKDAIIAEMLVVNGTLLVRNGGSVLVQKLVINANTGAQTCISEMKDEGDFSLDAYDTSTGKPLWIAEDLKSLGDKFKSITNMLTDGQEVFVASDRNLFALDPKTGSAKWKTDISAMKIGKPFKLHFIDTDVLLEGEEGIARLKQGDGSKIYATNTDKNLGWFFADKVFYVWCGKKSDDRCRFIRFNLQSGAIEGIQEEDTYNPYFSPDGNEFIRKSGNTLSRYRTI